MLLQFFQFSVLALTASASLPPSHSSSKLSYTCINMSIILLLCPSCLPMFSFSSGSLLCAHRLYAISMQIRNKMDQILCKKKKKSVRCREWSTSDFHSFDIPNGEANHLSRCQRLSVCGWMSALLQRQQLQITVNHRTNSVPNFSETHLQVQIFLYGYTHTHIRWNGWLSCVNIQLVNGGFMAGTLFCNYFIPACRCHYSLSIFFLGFLFFMLHGSVGECKNICNNAAKWETAITIITLSTCLKQIFDTSHAAAPCHHN